MSIYLVINDDTVSHETHSLGPLMTDLRARVEKEIRGGDCSGVRLTVGLMSADEPEDDSTDEVILTYMIHDAGEEVE